jgi:hypothetical protein
MVIAGEGIGISGPGVFPAGMLDTQMGPSLSYTAGPLDAEQPLVFILAPSLEPEQPSSQMPPLVGGEDVGTTDESLVGLLVGVVSLAVAAVVVFFLWRTPARTVIPQRALPLVRAMASLDEGFETGEVSDKTYRRKRSALKRELRSLLERMDDRSS